MNNRPQLLTTFEPDKIIQPTYTGGDVSLDVTGRILATCLGEDAVLSDLHNGDFLARIEGDGEILTALKLTPSASCLITCSRSLSMRIYSLESADDSNELTTTLLRTLKPHSTPVVSATIDHTGTLLATGGADGVIKLWDIRGGYVTHTFRGHTGVISALKFFEAVVESTTKGVSAKHWHKSQGNGKGSEIPSLDSYTSAAFRLASGGEDGKVRIWDLVERKAVATLDSHVSVVRGLEFSTKQNILVSGSRDRTIIIWDARTWKVRKVVPVLEGVECIGFVEYGDLLYTGGERGRLRIWETDTGREVTKEQEPGGEADGIVHVFHQTTWPSIVCVHNDQSIILRSVKSLKNLQPTERLEPLPTIRHISGTHDEIIDLALVAPSHGLLALATNSEAIKLVSVFAMDSNYGATEEDSNRGKYFGADVSLLEGHDDIIICLAVDWSGCWLATGAKDNTARLWRIDHEHSQYECFATFTGHAESIGAVALPNSPPPTDSPAFKEPADHPPQFLVTGSQDKTIKRWEISPKAVLSGDKKSPRALFTRKAHDKDINAIDINHNSTLFASASQDRLVKIWSIEEGETQGVLRGHRRGVWSVKFAPKDTPAINGDSGATKLSRGLILTGSGDKTVKIWSLSDYSCLRTLEGHTNSVLKVLWLPPIMSESASASRRPALVASAGGDGLVKVWDSSSGECSCTLDNHTDRVWALASNLSTGHLISGGADSVITFWANTTESTAAAATAASTERVEQEQTLLNHVHNGNYREAIVLALQLNHPARLLALLTDAVKTYPQEQGSLSGLRAVDDVLVSLADEQLYALLLRIRDWNTNARTAPVAQRILWVIMKSYPAARLVGLRKNGRGLGDVLEGLKAYTERHYRRMEELVEESYVVDFVVRGMEEGGFVGDVIGHLGGDLSASDPSQCVDVVMAE